jgi:hypothetical protein
LTERDVNADLEMEMELSEVTSGTGRLASSLQFFVPFLFRLRRD